VFRPGIPVEVFLKEADRFPEGEISDNHNHVYRVEVFPAAETASQVCFRIDGSMEVPAKRTQEAQMFVGDFGGQTKNIRDKRSYLDLISNEPQKLRSKPLYGAVHFFVA
jgi:hypothetical protein